MRCNRDNLKLLLESLVLKHSEIMMSGFEAFWFYFRRCPHEILGSVLMWRSKAWHLRHLLRLARRACLHSSACPNPLMRRGMMSCAGFTTSLPRLLSLGTPLRSLLLLRTPLDRPPAWSTLVHSLLALAMRFALKS